MTLPLTLIIANNNKNNSNDANIKNNVCKNDTTDHRTDKRLFRKVSPRIQHLQTRLLGAVHVQCDSGARSLQSLNSAGANNDAARDINTDGGAWNCRTSRVSSSSEHSLLVRVTKNGPSCHPISLTARQLVQPDVKKPLAITVSSSSASDSTTSSQQQQQRRPRTRLERARVLTKHTERPDMFVRQDDQGEGLFERTLNDHRRFAESVSVSRPLSLSRTSLSSPSGVVSDGARVICDPSHRHRSATERLSSVIERVKHSHQHSNHLMMPTCVSNCIMPDGCKNGANCYQSPHPHGKVSTSTRLAGVAEKNCCCGHRCCCCCCCTDTDQHSGHQRHFGARGCHNFIGSQCGNAGTRGEHRCRAESIDRDRSRTGHRSSMSSEDVASRRSKSVVRFFDSECVDGGVSSAVRRSRSIEHLAGAPPRGALRTSSSTSSSWCSSGQHVVKPLLVEVDGCVLVNTSQEESGFESDEPLRCLPADLHERFFYCRDGYYSDKQRHRPAISAGFYYARAPAKKSGVGGVSSSRRQFRKRYAVDRNNNNVGNGGSGSSSAGGRHKHHHAPSVHPINGRCLSKTSLAVAPGAIIMPASRDHRCSSGRAGHVHRLSAGLHRMFIGGRKSGDSVGGHVDCVDYRRCWDSSAALNHRAVFARAGSRSSRVRFSE